jgi:hypothetical protein
MATKKRTTKKAVTLLTRVEELLAEVLVECSSIEKSVEKNVREIVLTARKSIGSAIDFISAAASPAVKPKAVKTRAKAPAKAKKPAVAHVARKRAVTAD